MFKDYKAIVLPGDEPEVEKELRDALYRLVHEANSDGGVIRNSRGEITQYGDCVTRPVVVTLFNGAYGVAGAALCINGSPPKGIVVVHTGSGALFYDHQRPYLDVIRLWRSKGSERISLDFSYRTARYKLAAAKVVIDYLTREYKAGRFGR